MLKHVFLLATVLAVFSVVVTSGDKSPTVNAQGSLAYPIVDTGQTYCFSAQSAIDCGSAFNGQDAQYAGLQPAYQDNGDGTVTDLNTGLMWIQDPGPKTTYRDAMTKLETYTFAGYDDWRLPTIKELYSLTWFMGIDPSSITSTAGVEGLAPFIDEDYFVFLYGDESGGARVIDSQWLTSTVYNATVMNGQSCFFGFNFADGRIKCYPLNPGGSGGYFALFVRGNQSYGINDFVDNGDGTINDNATGLMWMQDDNGEGTVWQEALDYCETSTIAGYDDWRLPNIKELQSIVVYTRAPDATNSAALDPIFNISTITNEAGQLDYPFFWSSTTLISYPNRVHDATYISFGRAMGYMEAFGGWIDVHGAGAQRSDDKLGQDEQSLGFGPQGDARRADNYVRCVRGGDVQPSSGSDPATLNLPTDSTTVPTTAPDAQSDQPNQEQNQPPQPAIDACMNQSTGAACSFQTPNGTISGTCNTIPDGTLACTPNQ